MRKAGHPYRSVSNLPQAIDAVIIGSGIGGLCAAALLAKEGKKTVVLEQHYAAGGFTHVFKREDYEWDVGLHYIGNADDKNSTVRKVFDYITEGKLEWTSMDEVYDIAVFGNKEYRFYKGKENCKAQFKQYFPAEKDRLAIDKYFNLLDKVDQLGLGFYAEKILPEVLAKIAGPFLRRSLLKYADKTTLSALLEITDNEKLIGVLTAQYGDYGLPPAESSFYMHAMVANHYMNGGAYPVGGASSIASAIAAVIETNGGMVVTGASVKSILTENNKVIGVKMEDGKQILSNIVISDAGIKNTFLNLLEKNIQEQYLLQEKIAFLKPSLAHICLYIGLKKSAEELQLPKCNYWVFPDNYNHDEVRNNYKNADDNPPVAYISFPSAKDPEFTKRHPDKSTVEIVILVPFYWFKKWENTILNKRGEDYQIFKEKIKLQLLKTLLHIKPHLKEEIDYCELSTPLSTQTFMHTYSGEIYGLAHTPERFRQRILKPLTPLKNLYLTGQDVFTCGVSGAMMGGVICATAILKKNMLAKIK